jgi:hypothetical protein
MFSIKARLVSAGGMPSASSLCVMVVGLQFNCLPIVVRDNPTLFNLIISALLALRFGLLAVAIFAFPNENIPEPIEVRGILF